MSEYDNCKLDTEGRCVDLEHVIADAIVDAVYGARLPEAPVDIAKVIVAAIRPIIRGGHA